MCFAKTLLTILFTLEADQTTGSAVSENVFVEGNNREVHFGLLEANGHAVPKVVQNNDHPSAVAVGRKM